MILRRGSCGCKPAGSSRLALRRARGVTQLPVRRTEQDIASKRRLPMIALRLQQFQGATSSGKRRTHRRPHERPYGAAENSPRKTREPTP
jgi:hypothetical protein